MRQDRCIDAERVSVATAEQVQPMGDTTQADCQELALRYVQNFVLVMEAYPTIRDRSPGQAKIDEAFCIHGATIFG